MVVDIFAQHCRAPLDCWPGTHDSSYTSEWSWYQAGRGNQSEQGPWDKSGYCPKERITCQHIKSTHQLCRHIWAGIRLKVRVHTYKCHCWWLDVILVPAPKRCTAFVQCIGARHAVYEEQRAAPWSWEVLLYCLQWEEPCFLPCWQINFAPFGECQSRPDDWNCGLIHQNRAQEHHLLCCIFLHCLKLSTIWDEKGVGSTRSGSQTFLPAIFGGWSCSASPNLPRRPNKSFCDNMQLVDYNPRKKKSCGQEGAHKWLFTPAHMLLEGKRAGLVWRGGCRRERSERQHFCSPSEKKKTWVSFSW